MERIVVEKNNNVWKNSRFFLDRNFEIFKNKIEICVFLDFEKNKIFSYV